MSDLFHQTNNPPRRPIKSGAKNNSPPSPGMWPGTVEVIFTS